MANVYNVLTTQRNRKFGLRGNMAGATLAFTPIDNGFGVGFYTEDAKTYTLTALHKFRVNGILTTDTSFTFGGTAGLFVEFIFEPQNGVWVAVENNLVAGIADAGTGTPAPAGGTGRRAEVAVIPAADGSVTLDGLVSDTFLVKLDQAKVTLKNPINFTTQEEILVTFVQDDTGGRLLAYDRNYLLANAQPYKPPQSPKAIAQARIKGTMATGSLQWLFNAAPDYAVAGGYGPITDLARIGTVKYLTIDTAFTAWGTGQTVYVSRNGTGAEATATKVGSNTSEVYTLAGEPVPANGTDQRPILKLLAVDFSNGGVNRPAWGKSVINFEGSGTFNVRDLVIGGCRNDDMTARGIGPNGGCSVNISNVKITDCPNGMLTGNADYTGDIYIEDSEFVSNGLKLDGSSHNVYFGNNSHNVWVIRSTFADSIHGHDFKSRTAYTEIKQSKLSGSREGRAIDYPNGGQLLVEDSILEKFSNASQNDLVRIAGESVDTSRPRSYIFRRVRFSSDRAAGTDSTFVWNMDDTTDVIFIDCEFVGANVLANNSTGPDGRVTVNGVRGRFSIQNTGGPLGPTAGLQVGYVAKAMTPAA